MKNIDDIPEYFERDDIYAVLIAFKRLTRNALINLVNAQADRATKMISFDSMVFAADTMKLELKNDKIFKIICSIAMNNFLEQKEEFLANVELKYFGRVTKNRETHDFVKMMKGFPDENDDNFWK